MTPAETIQKILDSDEFVVEELKKIQTLFELKRVIRYNHTREHEEHTESVAEHIFGMHCLVDYFLPLEDIEGRWNKSRIRDLVQYHDIDEILTGDTIGYLKTTEQEDHEHDAAKSIIAVLPDSMQETFDSLLAEYTLRATPEAKFAKAIDKIEPVFHLYNQTGKDILAINKTTKDQNDRIKLPYMLEFPIIKRFTEVMSDRFEKEGFFH
ncbi:MAG: HD domain-containing protein [Candidatus Pacebacteria bacterium]|nr:HD domain-containing protein [Candidatus Paceibacterota bacterium]